MISVIEGSILDSAADAIVNPANSFLTHAGGLARVIADAARGPMRDSIEWHYSGTGPVSEHDEIGTAWNAEQRAAPLLPTGAIHVTSAGHLPYEGIIHAVGPIWGGGGYMETDLLEICMENVCNEAIQRGWLSLAVPAISCGIFGFPVDAAARILVQVAGWYEDDALDVAFYVMGDEHRVAFEQQISAPLFG